MLRIFPLFSKRLVFCRHDLQPERAINREAKQPCGAAACDDGEVGYGKGIINNAKTKILLNLEEEEARRVQSILHLSEAEVMEITHFERGNGLISTNNNNVTVEIKCSQMEKDLITTGRRELQELLSQSDGVDIA